MRSTIMKKWLNEEEKIKNLKPFTKKVIKVWTQDKPFYSWDHRLQIFFIILIKVFKEEAINNIPNIYISKILGGFFLKNKYLINKTKDIDKEIFKQIIEKELFTTLFLKKIFLVNKKDAKVLLKNERILSNIHKNSFFSKKNINEVTIAYAKYKKDIIDFQEEEDIENITLYNKLWGYHKKFKGPHIEGIYNSFTYETCETPEIMFLDNASDCCQGLNSAGESCMFSGISQENEGFIVIRNKKTGLIFAQTWIRSIGRGIILLDSIEFKGDFNKSIGYTVLQIINDLKKKYKYVAIGLSPNKEELNDFLKNYVKSVKRFIKLKRFINRRAIQISENREKELNIYLNDWFTSTSSFVYTDAAKDILIF